MEPFFKNDEDRAVMRTVIVLLGLAIALYFGMKFVNEIKMYNTIGMAPENANTIDVQGTGDAFAIPNVAAIGFTVEQKDATVAAAQGVVNTKMAAATAFLKTAGIADADIQTVNYSANPEYSYPTPCVRPDVPCPATAEAPKLLDYDVSESVLVKVRDTSAAGKVVDGLGSIGVTDISGPDFTVDDPSNVQAQARKIAIDDAQAKAQTLASDLGVHLVRIVSFSEDNGGAPEPIMMNASAMGASAPQAPEAQVSAGQNKYTSNVTITYEIR